MAAAEPSNAGAATRQSAAKVRSSEARALGDRAGTVFRSTLAAGAAHEDGTIQLRDQLTHVDDTSVASLALEQILDLIKGGEGTKVHLTLWRGERAFRVELRRKRVKQVGLVSTATKRSLHCSNAASAGRKTLSSITTGS